MPTTTTTTRSQKIIQQRYCNNNNDITTKTTHCQLKSNGERYLTNLSKNVLKLDQTHSHVRVSRAHSQYVLSQSVQSKSTFTMATRLVPVVSHKFFWTDAQVDGECRNKTRSIICCMIFTDNLLFTCLPQKVNIRAKLCSLLKLYLFSLCDS